MKVELETHLSRLIFNFFLTFFGQNENDMMYPQISNNQNRNDLASVPLFPPKMVLTFCKTNAGEK